MLRYLNMFIIIGLILLAVSLAGFATHDRFLLEPGQAANGSLSLIYLGASALMIVNGLLSIRLAPPVRPAPKTHSDGAGAEEDFDDGKARVTS